jgi:hypothetical protein
MKRIKLLTALALGVVASSSGALQVGAATYNFFVDFGTKEVANFNDFKQTFNPDTYDLETKFYFEFTGLINFDSCPTIFTMNMTWRLQYQLNGTGPEVVVATASLPDFLCTTVPTAYVAKAQGTLNPTAIAALVNDDASFLKLYSDINFISSAAINGRTISLRNYDIYFHAFYEFNTTYLFNFFLSDQQYRGVFRQGGWTIGSTETAALEYVYTTAGNDRYQILNTGSSIGQTRKKYAIDYNEEFFRGESVGSQFYIRYRGGVDTDTFTSPTEFPRSRWTYDYHYLNVANLAQAIVDAPVIEFTEENCAGGFLDINVGCYVNNAIAYLVNDAPIISDAFTLLNTGIELAAQTFGVIGAFSDDNVFGYLILVGFGFIAVKWFLKSDE